MSIPKQLLKELSKQPMSDKEIALRLIELYSELHLSAPLDDFINMYLYITESLSTNTKVKIEFGLDNDDSGFIKTN